MAEVSGIFKLLVTYVNSDLKELVENNVKVRVLGDYTTAAGRCGEESGEDTGGQRRTIQGCSSTLR